MTSRKTFPPQSLDIPFVNSWPYPVEPVGLGKATMYPDPGYTCQSPRNASAHCICGPPWTLTIRGYFFFGSKSCGVTMNVCILRPVGELIHNSWAGRMSTASASSLLKNVRRLAVPSEVGTLQISRGSPTVLLTNAAVFPSGERLNASIIPLS